MSNKIKTRRGEAKKLFKKSPGRLESVNLADRWHPDWMTRAYSNNRYTVMIDDNAKTNKGIAIKAMIQQHDNKPITNHWSEIQNIKNELFGSETVGIEYFPKASELVDEKNIYWLWIFHEDQIPMPI